MTRWGLKIMSNYTEVCQYRLSMTVYFKFNSRFLAFCDLQGLAKKNKVMNLSYENKSDKQSNLN